MTLRLERYISPEPGIVFSFRVSLIIEKNSNTNSNDNALFDRLVANSYWAQEDFFSKEKLKLLPGVRLLFLRCFAVWSRKTRDIDLWKWWMLFPAYEILSFPTCLCLNQTGFGRVEAEAKFRFFSILILLDQDLLFGCFSNSSFSSFYLFIWKFFLCIMKLILRY